jgi:hypothetical protein
METIDRRGATISLLGDLRIVPTARRLGSRLAVIAATHVVACWPFATFRYAAEFGRYRGHCRHRAVFGGQRSAAIAHNVTSPSQIDALREFVRPDGR